MKYMLDFGAFKPVRAHTDDAGLDLRSMKSGWIFPKCRKVFRTGVHVAIPKGYVGLLTSKSGLMCEGMTSRGTIDSGYTGDIKVVLFNHSWRFIKIKEGQKISQLVIMPIITPELDQVLKFDETERGTGGFGSSGAF